MPLISVDKFHLWTLHTSIEQAAWKEDIKWGEVLMTQCPKYSNGTNQFYLLSERICAQSNICVNENEGYWHLPLKHCISYFENNNDSTVIHNSSNLMKDYFDINKQDFFCVIRNPMTKMISEFKYLQNFRISRKVTNDLFGCDNDLLNSWIQIMLTHYKAISSNNKRKYCWIVLNTIIFTMMIIINCVR
eukprot:469619_1